MAEIHQLDGTFDETVHQSAAHAAAILVGEGMIDMHEARGVIRRGRGTIRKLETDLGILEDKWIDEDTKGEQ